MKNIFKQNFFVALFLGGFLMCRNVQAACTGASPTWTTTPDYDSVTSCISSATAGDTINVSAGSCTWESQLSVSKGISLIGAGKSNLTIICGGANYSMISYTPTSFSADTPFRVSGFTLDGGGKCAGISLNVSGGDTPQTKVRIDHNVLQNFKAYDTSYGVCVTNGGAWGVIDNNTCTAYVPFRNGNGNNSWWNTGDGMHFGSNQNMYYEDNIINTGTLVSDCQVAERYAFRYNTINYFPIAYYTVEGPGVTGETFVLDTQTFTWRDARAITGEVSKGATMAEAIANMVAAISADLSSSRVVCTAKTGSVMCQSLVLNYLMPFSENSSNLSISETNGSGYLINSYQTFDLHGNWYSSPSNQAMSCFGAEVYGNYLNLKNNSYGGRFFDQRGGSVLAFLNNFDTAGGSVSSQIREEEADTDNPTTNQCSDDLTYTCSKDGQHQHVANSYYWRNRKTTTGALVTSFIGAQNIGNVINENQQFWQDNSSFNGTSGIGCGTLSQMNAITPTTTGVGFWVPNASIDPTASSCTDLTNWVGANNTLAASVNGNIGTLYKCRATNVWAEYYTPYKYPHPLRAEDNNANTTPPAAPTNLTVN